MKEVYGLAIEVMTLFILTFVQDRESKRRIDLCQSFLHQRVSVASLCVKSLAEGVPPVPPPTMPPPAPPGGSVD